MKLLRGRVLIREDMKAEYAHLKIIVPDVFTTHDKDAVARSRKFHVGTVMQAGPPMLTKSGAEVPLDFTAGERVVFHFEHHEKGWTVDLGEGPVVVVPQWCIDAVLAS